MRTDIDYRLKENRFAGFDCFYKFMLATGDWSPDINVETWIASDLNYDFEKRCVMALFHGATYAGPCETMFSDKFPLFTPDIIEEIVQFFYDNQKRLLFSPDCKYRKMRFEKFLRSVAASLKKHETLGRYIAFSLKSDPINNYNNLKARCMRDWYHWGRMGHWCFTEALTKFIDAPLIPPTMEFKDGASHRSGWAFCVGADKLVDRRCNPKEVAWLEKSALDYIKTINHADAGFLSLETACCNYKRQHKGSRYGGCYIDEQGWEIDYMKELWPEYKWLWNKYFEGRKAIIPHSLLAERNLDRVSTKSAYIPSWNKALKKYGRIPRVEAFFNETPQMWHELDEMKDHWSVFDE
ncbi:MAG: hypothetical protein VW683_02795 [Betaproteobacteria bacterium]